MVIDTQVFVRIFNEKRETAIKHMTRLMKQTYRYGFASDEYLNDLATKIYDGVITDTKKFI